MEPSTEQNPTRSFDESSSIEVRFGNKEKVSRRNREESFRQESINRRSKITNEGNQRKPSSHDHVTGET